MKKLSLLLFLAGPDAGFSKNLTKNVIKVAHRYAVQGSDTTMLPIVS